MKSIEINVFYNHSSSKHTIIFQYAKYIVNILYNTLFFALRNKSLLFFSLRVGLSIVTVVSVTMVLLVFGLPDVDCSNASRNSTYKLSLPTDIVGLFLSSKISSSKKKLTKRMSIIETNYLTHDPRCTYVIRYQSTQFQTKIQQN